MAGSEYSSSKAPGLAERPLSGNRDGRFGSAAVSDPRNITVGLRPLKSHTHIMLSSNQLKLK